jgi:hypothetical protein
MGKVQRAVDGRVISLITTDLPMAYYFLCELSEFHGACQCVTSILVRRQRVYLSRTWQKTFPAWVAIVYDNKIKHETKTDESKRQVIAAKEITY